MTEHLFLPRHTTYILLLLKLSTFEWFDPGMAYRFTDISELFEILVIGIGKSQDIGQISALNIGYILVIFTWYISKTPIYQQFQ